MELGIFAILLTETLNVLGVLILLPIQPFFAISLGATAFDLSIISSAFALAQFLVSPVLGTASDKIGRKPVMLAGLAAAGLLYLVQAHVDSVATFVLIRFTLGVACSTGPVEMAYIIDSVSDEKERLKVLSWQSSCCTAGAFVGPAIAGVLAPFGFPFLCQVMASICLLNLGLGIALWTEPKKQTVEDEAGDKEAGEAPQQGPGSYRAVLTDRTTGTLLILAAINAFGWMVSDGPEAIFMKEHFGFGERQLATFFMAICGAAFLFTFKVPRIVERIGSKDTCAAGSLGAAVTLLSLLCVTDWWEPYFYGIVGCGFFGTVVNIATMNVLTTKCPEDQRGFVMGLSGSLSSFGSFAGPVIGGALYDWNNYVPYALTSLSFTIAALCYMTLPPDVKATPLLPKQRWSRAVQKISAARRLGGPGGFRHGYLVLAPEAGSPCKILAPQLVASRSLSNEVFAFAE
mmetsp:Transcript_35622/g.80469  ORF Transcript_35622/g.80469 Transcript_35622/m.80469 type:complete len:459 (-) Transcript_35622:52-1428(-)